MATGDKVYLVDNSLVSLFSWAGGSFPFNYGGLDTIISSPTTWNDAAGYKKVGKLTINADQVLSIKKSPFYIFGDELILGNDNSCIDISGNDGSALGAASTWCASGAFAESLLGVTITSATSSTAVIIDSRSSVDDEYNGMVLRVQNLATGVIQERTITDFVASTKTVTISPNWDAIPSAGAASILEGAKAQGGFGGGILFLVFNKITGANGSIKADGGNGWVSTVPKVLDVTTRERGGQGALSASVGSVSQELWQSSKDYSFLLGSGGGIGGSGGGSGIGGNASSGGTVKFGGGSGIGSGGGYLGSSAACPSYPAISPFQPPSILGLLKLAELGCLGGGGGGSSVYHYGTTAKYNLAGGGGGGAIVLFSKSFSAVPNLQANGGGSARYVGASSTDTAGDGSAGVTYLVAV